MARQAKFVLWFEEVSSADVGKVGGKNSSLGEMIRGMKDADIKVPDGFATTAHAYRTFLQANNLTSKIKAQVRELKNGAPLSRVGEAIRRAFLQSQFPDEIVADIKNAYRKLSRRYNVDEANVAVRSSATAEDLPDASFAGQQESFLNITGEATLLDACLRCYASLFTDRAISYREEKSFDHLKVALSVGVQKMVRSDKASAGVMFTLDPDTGFRNLVVINSAWGLGEAVVQGQINPDEFAVFKPLVGENGFVPVIRKALGEKEHKVVYATGGAGKATKMVDTSRKERQAFTLTDAEMVKLAGWACAIETHYGRPMDIEWAKDGDTGEIFIVQARPETVHSLKTGSTLKTYRLKGTGEKLLSGLAIGNAIATGKVQVIKGAEDIDQFEDGSILVTGMTDPDWVPIMRRASGIITDLGGRTSHAAIVSRELGIVAVVGTGKATETLKNGQEVTISCAEGDIAYIYDGKVEYEVADVDLSRIPETRTKVMMNLSTPAAAFSYWRLPCQGIGLGRIEFIISNVIKVHPMALVRFNEVTGEACRQIQELTRNYEDRTEYFVDHLAQGIAQIAASRYPDPVIVRMSDFKTNEYANLIGGKQFEPKEENPMLGFRGASRYYSPRYREGFALECRALKRVREEMGLTNVIVMIPFCRTPEEGQEVIKVMAENGLKRGQKGLQVYVMAEIPSNIILAKEFARHFDGFSIGSNDLTQLILGVDRDSTDLAFLFDDRHIAVRKMIIELIKSAHRQKRKVSLCGQAPSDHPDFAAFLVEAGIDSISVNPDSVVTVLRQVAATEAKMKRRARSKTAV